MVFIPGGEFSRGRTTHYVARHTNLPWYPNPLKDDLPVREHLRRSVLSGRGRGHQRALRRLREGNRASSRRTTGSKARFPSREEASGGQRELGRRRGVLRLGGGSACPPKPSGSGPAVAWLRAHVPVGRHRSQPKPTRISHSRGPDRVCSKKKNYFGLCDIIGNVWEWTADWYEPRLLRGRSRQKSARAAEKGIYRVLRGGSWFDQPAAIFDLLLSKLGAASGAQPDHRLPLCQILPLARPVVSKY